MDLLIIAKWLVQKDVEGDYHYPDLNDPTQDPYASDYTDFNLVHYSPPIITTMIDIFLSGAGNEKTNDKT
jgi:hypothetical protein